MAFVEIKNLSKKYNDLTALDNISLTLDKGKIIGLLGPNGSGKSTLIKLMNGLLTPTKGNITVDGHEIGIETKKIISYLPERTYLDMSLKIDQTLQFFKDMYEDFDIDKAYSLLEDLQIDKKADMKALSKGTKEKVQLILVMSRKADLYILDEPIAGVDPAARDYILNTILNNFNPNASLLISTHLVYDIERILDEVVFINKGRIVLQESADFLREKYDSSIDKAFREVFRYV